MKDSIKHLLKSYFFYFFIMISFKFIILRYLLLQDTSIWAGIWYDASFILIFMALIELVFKRGKVIAYTVLDLFLSLLFIGMLIYERYFGTVPTYYDLSQLNQVGSVNESMWLLVNGTDFLFLADLLLLAVIGIVGRKWTYPAKRTSNFAMSVFLIAGLVIAIFNFQMNKGEPILDSALFAKENGLFTTQFVQYYQDQTNSEKAFAFSGEDQNVTQQKIEELKGNSYTPMSGHEHFGVAEDRNLIVVQIESLQDFVIGESIDGQEITPNINEWLKESMYFTDVYQQIGSGNTSDAEFLMNTSLYPLGKKATTDQVGGMELPSLPRMLDEQSYHTVTMHADEVEYWNRDELYPALGFDDYYDDKFYGEKDMVGFGPSDGWFYHRSMGAIDEINEEYDKFYAHVLSLTSHTPFEMPDDKEGLDLPSDYEGTLTGNYLQSVHYADKALGEFFQDLKDRGLWEESVIALYGDHSGLHGKLLESEDQDLLADFLGERYSLLNRFNIPFIVGVPGEKDLIGTNDHTGGQIDMMPTLLNLLGVEPESLYFGHNLLHYENNLLGMRYYVPTSSFFNNGTFYIAQNSRFDARILNMNTNERIEDTYKDPNNAFEEEREDILQLLQWSDAYFESLR
ncbi:sulfatase-like hydrolase/transferase [Halobacillus litoralis]|uniref:Sulfatase-like hydrolase/transferase n=1 Tax=Halobacillus litoralis TaxID=45668 RepID=A0A845DTJ7_9BACI|nr:LTA synthase family protein [Halobacillus litoralis]MYL20810.1 sulfatase-like hydrolase/transferase [Halobacillus litoralis]